MKPPPTPNQFQEGYIAALGLLTLEEKNCLDCGEDYPMGEMPNGLCPDCQDVFDSLDAEDAFEKAMDL